MKIIVTFGSSGLPELWGVVDPMSVMLVVDGNTLNESRNKVMNSFIGRNFFTSYEYNGYVDEFKKMGMTEYTIEDLENMIRERK